MNKKLYFFKYILINIQLFHLTNGVGKNDGSVNGKRYFSCHHKHVIFAPLARLQRLSDADFYEHQKIQNFKSHNLNSHRGIEEDVPKTTLRHKPFTFTKAPSHPPKNNQSPSLSIGSHVFCYGGIGTVYYIGGVDFREGVWVG